MQIGIEPPPELCRVHIRAAAELMLARPPTQGKAALSAVREEVQLQFFPTDWVRARTVLERGPLGRARPALVRNFIVSTVKRICEDVVDRDEAQRLAAALRAVCAMHREEHQRVEREPSFAGICVSACTSGRGRRVLRMLALIPEVRPVVLAATQTQLEELLNRMVGTDLVEAIDDGLEVPPLATCAEARVPSLTITQLAEAVALRPRRQYAARALSYYLASRSYDAANRAVEDLILPLSEFMTVADAVQIAAKAREPDSQIGGGYRYAAVKTRLQELRVWPIEPAGQIDPAVPG